MSDLYSEILVKRQSGSTDMLKKGGLITLILLLAAGGIVFTPILLLAAVVLGAVAWFFIFPLFHVEYEYLIVNKELDIDAIYAQQKRKTVAKYDLENMDLLAPLNSHRMEYYNGNTQMKVRDFSSGDKSKIPYAMVVKGDNGAEKVLLEIDANTAESIKKTYTNKVFLD